MWKNIVERGNSQMAIWRMRIARWVTKITDTHSEYVMLIAFPLQQRLHEHAPFLRSTYTVCLALLYKIFFVFCVIRSVIHSLTFCALLRSVTLWCFDSAYFSYFGNRKDCWNRLLDRKCAFISSLQHFSQDCFYFDACAVYYNQVAHTETLRFSRAVLVSPCMIPDDISPVCGLQPANRTHNPQLHTIPTT
jgi:hypothetical protein